MAFNGLQSDANSLGVSSATCCVQGKEGGGGVAGVGGGGNSARGMKARWGVWGGGGRHIWDPAPAMTLMNLPAKRI